VRSSRREGHTTSYRGKGVFSDFSLGGGADPESRRILKKIWGGGKGKKTKGTHIASGHAAKGAGIGNPRTSTEAVKGFKIFQR